MSALLRSLARFIVARLVPLLAGLLAAHGVEVPAEFPAALSLVLETLIVGVVAVALEKVPWGRLLPGRA